MKNPFFLKDFWFNDPYIIVCFILWAIMLYGIIKGSTTVGGINIWGRFYSRKEDPFLYWISIFLHFALGLLFFASAYSHSIMKQIDHPYPMTKVSSKLQH